jgi:hypothetical protein
MRPRAIRDIIIMQDQFKKCARCGFERPKTSFFKHSASKDGLQPYCKTCGAIVFNLWKAKHPERYKAYFKEYAKMNGVKHHITQAQRDELYDKYRQGVTVKKLASEFGIHLTTAYLIIRKMELAIDTA